MATPANISRAKWRVRHDRNLSERTEKIRRPKCSAPRRVKEWR